MSRPPLFLSQKHNLCKLHTDIPETYSTMKFSSLLVFFLATFSVAVEAKRNGKSSSKSSSSECYAPAYKHILALVLAKNFIPLDVITISDILQVYTSILTVCILDGGEECGLFFRRNLKEGGGASGMVTRKVQEEFSSPCMAAGGAAIFSVSDEEALGGTPDEEPLGGPFSLFNSFAPPYNAVGCVPLCDVDVELLQEECITESDPTDCDVGYAVSLSPTLTYCCPLEEGFA